MSHHECPGSHGPKLYSVYQSLDELSFERGIWSAALDGDIERLKKLLKTVDPATPDSSGYTALHYAARNGKEEACKILLGSRANPNAQTHGGSTALHRAAFLGHLNIVNLLLQFKADPSVCDSDGKTALHKATEGQHLAVVKTLVDLNPALKSMKDNKGFIPFDYVQKNNTHLLELLHL